MVAGRGWTDISASLRIRVIGGQAIEQHAERAGGSPVAVARERVSNGFRWAAVLQEQAHRDRRVAGLGLDRRPDSRLGLFDVTLPR